MDTKDFDRNTYIADTRAGLRRRGGSASASSCAACAMAGVGFSGFAATFLGQGPARSAA